MIHYMHSSREGRRHQLALLFTVIAIVVCGIVMGKRQLAIEGRRAQIGDVLYLSMAITFWIYVAVIAGFFLWIVVAANTR